MKAPRTETESMPLEDSGVWASATAPRQLAPARGTVDAIVQLRSNLNQTFEFIASELPRLAGEMSLAVARLSEGGAVTEQERFTEVTAAKSSLESELLDASGWMKRSQSQLDLVLGELRPGVGGLFRALSDVRDGARQLRLLALNASFVAQRGGEGMRGFAAATAELIQIAAEQLRDSDEVIAIIEGVSERFAELEGVGRDLTKQVDSIASNPTDECLGKVMATLSAIEGRVGGVTERCRAIAEGIRHTMVTIQRQDILRQGLDHVELVALEMAHCEERLVRYSAGTVEFGDAMASAEMLRQGARLCSELVEQVHSDLTLFLGDVEASVAPLVEIADGTNDLAGDAISGVLGSEVSALRGAVEQLGQCLSAGSRAQHRRNEILPSLSDSVQKLPSRLRTFVERREQVRTLGVLVRRQDANAKGLVGAKAISEALDALLRETGASWATVLGDAELIRNKLREFARIAVRDDASMSVRLSEKLSALESVTDRMSTRAQHASVNTRQVVGGIGEAANRMLTQLGALRSDLARHGSLTASYRTLSERGTSFIEHNGGSISGVVELPERLQTLIDRFTILSHKQLATGDTASNTDDEAGSITLF
jgi:hypothetical protein